jgi:hydrogenase maturation protein HypF
MLLDRGGPIVIVSLRGDSPLASNVAPEFNSVGLMLPTTPLHALLCDLAGQPLICTSGNREGDPLVYRESEAETTLAGITDAWLHHDRPIVRPIDDSVVRIIAGAPCFLRLARGYAPHALPFHTGCREPLIALGGEHTAAIALFNGKQAVLGPQIGDLTNASACERWVGQLAAMADLYGVRTGDAVVVHDLHPEYFSSTWSQRHARRQMVQHHHAHIAAVMLEHGLDDREVLGLAWDGTGYGDDGSIWGGECLLASFTHYRRVAWLRPLPLLGGEQAVREPWRVAVALVSDALGSEVAAQLRWPDVSPANVAALLCILNKPRLSPKASSMGRLFDGVAALALGIAHAFDEGRPAMLLEAACDCNAEGAYAFDINANEVDWRSLIAAVFADVRRRVPPGVIAMRFHRAVANLAIATADKYPTLPLVTGGGVFQNAVVVELMAERLSRRAAWLRPRQLPPGDGGLAAGQLAIAAARLQHRH